MMRESVLILAFIAASYNLAYSQSIWNHPGRQSSIDVEVLHPSFKDDALAHISNLAMFWSAQLRLSDHSYFVGELPLANLRARVRGFDFQTGRVVELGPRSETVVGNPYVGLVAFIPNTSVFWEIGGRFPTENGSPIGLAADFDRFEGFYENIWSLQVKLNRMSLSADNFFTRLRIGPTVLGSSEGGEPQVFLDYGLKLGHDADKLLLALGVSGRYWISEMSEGNLGLSRRTSHQVGASATAKFGSIRPGIHLRMLIHDDLARLVDADEADFVAGIHLGVHL